MHKNWNSAYNLYILINHYIKYICERLSGNIKDYQKKYYGLKYSSRKGYKRCKMCGNMIENNAKNRQYCSACKKKKRKEINHNYYIKTVLKS